MVRCAPVMERPAISALKDHKKQQKILHKFPFVVYVSLQNRTLVLFYM